MTAVRVETARHITLRKRAEQTMGRIGLMLIVRPVRALPLHTAQKLGAFLGLGIYRLLSRYRLVAHRNLARFFSDVSLPERERMARAVFRHFGQWAMEFVKLPQLGRDEIDALTTVIGEEHLRSALARGKGVLLITGHFGNWEFLGRWLAIHGYTLSVVARRANNPAADRLLVSTREGNGAQVLARGNSVKGILQSLKRGEIVALLPDQNAADVIVPFLGVPTGTVEGPAVLHLRTGAPLLFSWCTRTASGGFRICFEPAFEADSTGNQRADVATIMAEVNARLGAVIREQPTQWLWLHDRWKSSPPEAPAAGGESAA